MSNNNSSSGGIGFFGLLTIVFIVLKLCKVIDWSWWWVTCPLWGPVALFLIIAPFIIVYKIRKDFYDKHVAGRKSKWQQRLDEMQKAQELRNKK